MTRLHLVRHAHAAAAFDEHEDPGLDDVGRAQAARAANDLAPLGPLPVVCSPLLRARQTAAAFERVWNVTARVDPAVGELPTPRGVDLADRGRWLRAELARGWSEVAPELHEWRARLLDALVAADRETLVVTHFVAINVAVGAATGDDGLVSCWPANASCTVLDVEDGQLRLVQLGEQATTTTVR